MPRKNRRIIAWNADDWSRSGYAMPGDIRAQLIMLETMVQSDMAYETDGQ